MTPSLEERMRRLEAENAELRKENAQKKAAAGAPKSPVTEAKQRRRMPKSRHKRVTSRDFFMPVGPGATRVGRRASIARSSSCPLRESARPCAPHAHALRP